MSTPVRLSLDSTLIDPRELRLLGEMYLPDDDIGNRWTLDAFTWAPTDAELAALPWPLAPDSDAIASPLTDLDSGPTAYFAQVVLADVPEEINPGAEGLGFIGGTLTGVDLRISLKTITVDLALARRVPRPEFSVPMLAVSPADIAVDFPTVAANDVDPAISAYDVRLVHP